MGSFGSDEIRDVEPVNEIFVVDDNDDYREILSSILELEGYRVRGFAEGSSLLDEALERVPICIFLDVMMPGLSGLEVLKQLHARDYAAPVFLISARGDASVIVEAMKNGAVDFFEKPFDPYAAVLKVRDAVDMWARRAADGIGFDPRALRFVERAPLLPTDRDVLVRIVAGISDQDIAAALGMNKRAVANRRRFITKKLGAKSSADLVRLVLGVRTDRREIPRPAMAARKQSGLRESPASQG
jgi:two-component system, LuxR family, response regulator FixJ